MKKNKKKKAARKQTLLGGAGKSLKKLGKGTTGRLAKLSTTQKVVGGAALVALGLGYLSQRLRKGTASPLPDATAAEEQLAAMEETA